MCVCPMCRSQYLLGDYKHSQLIERVALDIEIECAHKCGAMVSFFSTNTVFYIQTTNFFLGKKICKQTARRNGLSIGTNTLPS